MLRVASALSGLLFTSYVIATPIVQDGYSVELYAQGIGAITGITMDDSGSLYAADYAGGRVLKIADKNSVTEYSTGLSFITDLSFTDDGRLFASSSTGSNSNVFEIGTDGSSSIFSSGFSFPTSLESWGNDLYISESGDGDISRITPDGNNEIFISGVGASNGPYGISFDDLGNMYFIDHITGTVFSADLSGNISTVGSVTSFGGTFTGIGFDDLLLVSDVNTGSLIQFDTSGGSNVFASNFEGKGSPPAIGPNDFVYDGSGNLFVGDGDNIWKISSTIPEPSIIALMFTGLIGLIGFNKRRNAA